MQKKLIALAVAGLASTAAFAQTNVTIYGIVDYGYAYRFDARGLDATTNLLTNVGKPNSASQFNSGQQSGNRLGFKGTEDLGNGLKAVFLLEQGFALDTGRQAGAQAVPANTDASNQPMFNRQAYAGLSGNFGTVVGGRLYTPYYTFVSGLDPFGAGTVGSYRNAFSSAWQVSNGTSFQSLTDPLRVDNALAYISPSFGGFTVTAAFSNNANGDDSSGNNARNNTVYAVLGQYTAGGLTIGANYHAIQGGTTLATPSLLVPGVNDVQNFTLGGSYDFKVAKVMALYSYNNTNFNNSALPGATLSGDATLNNYMLGATVPFGKFAGKASYVYSDGNTAALGDAQQLAVGLDYNLSKRTNFYSAYSWIDNSQQRMAGVGDASVNGGSYTAASSGAPVGGVFQQGFQVGLRHMF
jgi:predicted porin